MAEGSMHYFLKISVSNECCSFELSIQKTILKKKYNGYHKNIKQHNSKIDEISILERFLISCDTEAWSNYIKL